MREPAYEDLVGKMRSADTLGVDSLTLTEAGMVLWGLAPGFYDAPGAPMVALWASEADSKQMLDFGCEDIDNHQCFYGGSRSWDPRGYTLWT
jgi:hypothetical protein